SQLSVNQDSGDPFLGAGSPVVPAVAGLSVTPQDILLPLGSTSLSSTPLSLELHIDEEGYSLTENQTPACVVPGDEDKSWEEEVGIYPEFSREGTLTPMTESSWMDECFTPSSCPGTPDAALDLPVQQPSTVDRLSASGQVGI
ncbi:hypothetical protein XENOCAPTIV_010111, partial [Xenoophorus captivus]